MVKRQPPSVLFLTLLAACGGGGTTDPNGNGGNNGLPNFTAKIDGAVWQASVAVTAQNPMPGLYSITGVRLTGADNYTMIFSLWNIKGPGTYPLGVGVQMQGGSVVLSHPLSSGWSTPLNGASGTITITTLTATRVVATFNFTADGSVTGGSGTKVITEGSMDVPVAGTGGVAAENQGHVFTGNIGGSFGAGGAAMVLTTGSNPTLTIVANNLVRSITLGLANVTGPGVYALSATTPVRTIGVSGMPGNPLATWTSQVGGSGSVTITTMSATRVIGSFTATLAPLTGGATGNLTVSGTFDMARQ